MKSTRGVILCLLALVIPMRSVFCQDADMQILLKDSSFGLGAFTSTEKPDTIGWQDVSFSSPVEFNVNAVHSIRRVLTAGADQAVSRAAARQDDSSAKQRFDFRDGTMIVGRLLSLDDDSIRIDSELLGELQVKRDDAIAMTDQSSGGAMIYRSSFREQDWLPLGDREDWTMSLGRLMANKQGAAIVGDLALPNQSRIDLSLTWRGAPNFVISLGTLATNRISPADQVPSAARLEVWNNQIALLRELDSSADIKLLTTLSPISPRIDLTIYLDQKKGTVIVCDNHGRLLGKIALPGDRDVIRPAIHVVNQGPVLTIERLDVRAWDGVTSFVQGEGQIVLKERDSERETFNQSNAASSVIQGKIVGFDPTKRELLIIREQDEEQRLPLADVRQADLATQAIAEQSSVIDQIEVLGPLDKSQPSDAEPSGSATSSKSSRDAIEFVLADGSRIGGRIESSNKDGFELKLAMLETTVRVPFEKVIAFFGNERSHSINLTQQKNGTLKTATSRFSGFLDEPPSSDLGPNAPNSGEPGSNEPTSSQATILRWHPHGSRTSGFISRSISGAIVYRTALPKTEQTADNEIKILKQQVIDRYSRSERGGVQQAGSSATNTSVNDSRFVGDNLITFRSGDSIFADVERIDDRGVYFQSGFTDTTFAAHAQVQEVVLNSTNKRPSITPAELERLKTVPRLQKDTPPTHILLSTTGDYLRCNLVTMSGKSIGVKAGERRIEIPTERVARVVWLHDRSWEEAKENNSSDDVTAEIASSDDHFQVHAIDYNDFGLTMRPTVLGNGTLSGESDLLGKCSIEVSDIAKLLFGQDIGVEVRKARDNPWLLNLARLPKAFMDAGQSSAGQSSDLIGAEASDFELPSLGQGIMRLGDQRGKVVVLDFWASWCAPCMRSLPELDRAIREQASEAVVFWAVNLGESSERAEQALKKLGIQPTVLLDASSSTLGLFNGNSIPYSVIIDKKGIVRSILVGANAANTEALNESLFELLKEN